MLHAPHPVNKKKQTQRSDVSQPLFMALTAWDTRLNAAAQSQFCLSVTEVYVGACNKGNHDIFGDTSECIEQREQRGYISKSSPVVVSTLESFICDKLSNSIHDAVTFRFFIWRKPHDFIFFRSIPTIVAISESKWNRKTQAIKCVLAARGIKNYVYVGKLVKV